MSMTTFSPEGLEELRARVARRVANDPTVSATLAAGFYPDDPAALSHAVLGCDFLQDANGLTLETARSPYRKLVVQCAAHVFAAIDAEVDGLLLAMR